MSQRGDDFHFNSGEDLSIGYDGHDLDTVDLYHLVESFLPCRDAGGSGGAYLLTLRRTRQQHPEGCA